MSNNKTYLKQRGMTMTELLVAVSASIIVTGATIKIFADANATYSITQNLAHTQQESRFALMQMSRHIQQAGYCVETDIPCNETTSRVIEGTEGGSDTSDSISVYYQAVDNSTDCAGHLVSKNDNVSNLYKVDEDAHELLCQSAFVNDQNKNISIALARNIDNLQIYYGIDQDNNNVVDCYVSAKYFNNEENCIPIISKKGPLKSSQKNAQKFSSEYVPSDKNVILVRFELTSILDIKDSKRETLNKTTVVLRNNFNAF